VDEEGGECCGGEDADIEDRKGVYVCGDIGVDWRRRPQFHGGICEQGSLEKDVFGESGEDGQRGCDWNDGGEGGGEESAKEAEGTVSCLEVICSFIIFQHSFRSRSAVFEDTALNQLVDISYVTLKIVVAFSWVMLDTKVHLKIVAHFDIINGEVLVLHFSCPDPAVPFPLVVES
jgi:hypothetical protein